MRVTRAQVTSMMGIVLNQSVDATFNIFKQEGSAEALMLEAFVPGRDMPTAYFSIQKDGSYKRHES